MRFLKGVIGRTLVCDVLLQKLHLFLNNIFLGSLGCPFEYASLSLSCFCCSAEIDFSGKLIMVGWFVFRVFFFKATLVVDMATRFEEVM